MSHLGDRAAALVDGQLSPHAAERATAHLAGCRPCRDLVELERLSKLRLASLQGPAPTADLVTRLLAMGGPSGPLPPRPGHVPGMPRPQPVPLRSAVGAGSGAGSTVGSAQRVATRPTARAIPTRASSTRPPGRPGVLTPRRTRLAAAVLGALSVMGVGVAGVAVSGAASGAAPRPLPPRLGSVTSPADVSILTSVARSGGPGTTFDWLQRSPSGTSTQRLLARR